MRTFVIIAFAVVAVLLVPVSQFVKAQIGPPQGNKVELCHITDRVNGTGKIISIADNAAALNAHRMMHGDCEDFEVLDADAGTCECEPFTEPMGVIAGDDTGDDDDDDDTGGDDDDDDDA